MQQLDGLLSAPRVQERVTGRLASGRAGGPTAAGRCPGTGAYTASLQYGLPSLCSPEPRSELIRLANAGVLPVADVVAHVVRPLMARCSPGVGTLSWASAQFKRLRASSQAAGLAHVPVGLITVSLILYIDDNADIFTGLDGM